MKIKILSYSFCFISLSCSSITSNINIYSANNNPNNRFSYLKESISDWNDADCYLDFSFTFKKLNYKVYSLTDENNYKGYFIVNDLNKVESMYVGNTEPDRSDISSLSPIFSNGDKIINEKKNEVNLINSTETYHQPPNLITDLYESYLGSFSNEQKITGCPTYFNPTDYMCTPTTFAMLISFYDRYSYLSNLYWGLLPLNHDDEKSTVDNFIQTLANDYFKTNSIIGTDYDNIIDGINNYFFDRGHGDYQCFQLYDYSSYTQFINRYKQPVAVSIRLAGDSECGHSILGIGCSSNINGDRFVVSHYGERNLNLGDYYVSSEYFKWFYYIGEKA